MSEDGAQDPIIDQIGSDHEIDPDVTEHQMTPEEEETLLRDDLGELEWERAEIRKGIAAVDAKMGMTLQFADLPDDWREIIQPKYAEAIFSYACEIPCRFSGADRGVAVLLGDRVSIRRVPPHALLKEDRDDVLDALKRIDPNTEMVAIVYKGDASTAEDLSELEERIFVLPYSRPVEILQEFGKV